MGQTPRRAKRHQRLETPPPMRFTERDGQILEAVYAYRVLTQHQLERLLFTGLNPNVARRRLFLLYHHAYLERQFLPTISGLVTSPVLYLLDKRGGEYLLQHSAHTEIRWKASDNKVGYLHLQHLLDINTFRIEMTLASQHYQTPLKLWVDDTTLHQDYDRVALPGVKHPVPIIPDGYFQLQVGAGKPMHFFLELDRGKMDLGRYKQKILAYALYATSGLSKRRFDTEGFRVLTVTLDEQRMHSLRQATEAAGGENRFWFGVLDQLTAPGVLSEPLWWLPQRSHPAALINPRQLSSSA